MTSHILNSLEFKKIIVAKRNTSEMKSFLLLQYAYAYAKYWLTYMKAIENILIKYLKLKKLNR